MATFLELCQRVRQETGIAGEGNPTSVKGQVGVLKKIVDRTQRAWIDIQASGPYWKFSRNQLTYVLTIGKQEYDQPQDIGLTTVDKWDEQDSFIKEVDGNDETELTWVPYHQFRRDYRTYPAGRPNVITNAPGGKLQFNRTPDKAYIITLDYWMTPELLVENGDIPSLPEHYHDAIVWKSVMTFAGNETATELFVYAKTMYGPIYNQLFVDQGEVPQAVGHWPIAKGSTVRRSRP